MFMNAPRPTAASTPRDPLPDRAEGCAGGAEEPAERSARHLRMLKELGEMGMALARLAHERAVGQSAAGQSAEGKSAEGGAAASGRPDASLVFTHVVRVVHQTMALEVRVAEEQRAREAAAATVAAKRQADAAREAAILKRASRARRKERVRQMVDAVISAVNDDWRVALDRGRALAQRLEDDEADPDLLDRPVEEIAARICRDLGIDLAKFRAAVAEAAAAMAGPAADLPLDGYYVVRTAAARAAALLREDLGSGPDPPP